MQVDLKGKQGIIAPLVTVIAAALLVVAFFLPYASAVESRRETLMSAPDLVVSESLGMTSEDIADVSLFEYARVYSAASEFGYDEEYAMLYVPLISAVCVLSVLTLLFALLRKPVATVVFSVLTVALVQLLNWDFEARGVIPSSSYDWGVAKWAYLAAGVIVIAGAIWQVVLRRRARRA